MVSRRVRHRVYDNIYQPGWQQNLGVSGESVQSVTTEILPSIVFHSAVPYTLSLLPDPKSTNEAYHGIPWMIWKVAVAFVFHL